MKRPAGTLLLMLLLTGCASLAPEAEREQVKELYAGVPADAREALRAGELDLVLVGEFSVRGEASITLESRRESGRALQGEHVARCLAVVKALAPTGTRAYGLLPLGDDLHEASKETCERGLGQSWEAWGRSLELGEQLGDGRTRLLGVRADLGEERLQAYPDGTVREEAVAERSGAELDALFDALETERGTGTLPFALTRKEEGFEEEVHVFTRGRGEELELVLECSVPASDRHLELRAEERDGFVLAYFGGGSVEDFSVNETMRPCDGEERTFPFPPSLAYTDASGEEREVYALRVIGADFDGPAGDRVEVREKATG